MIFHYDQTIFGVCSPFRFFGFKINRKGSTAFTSRLFDNVTFVNILFHKTISVQQTHQKRLSLLIVLKYTIVVIK